MQSPLEHVRTPSLTHSRASSSDSSGSSGSFHWKALPALPEQNVDYYSQFDNNELLRPASVAVLEQIDELSVGTFARKNSIETLAHIHHPHLDLAAREDSSPPHSPSSSSNPTPRAGSLTVRRLSEPASPTLGWTPRGSAFSMNSDLGDDSLSGPFGLEASLARLDVLSEDDEEEFDVSQQMLKPLHLDIPPFSGAQKTTTPKDGAFFSDKPDFSSYKWEAPVTVTPTLLGVKPPSIVDPSPKASPNLSHYVVPELQAASSSPPSEASMSLAGRLSVKIPSFSRNGWRGWRSGSQAGTPNTRTSGDYPTIFVADHAESLAHALQSEINTAVQQKMLEASNSSGSPKPKLSPQFSFGGRTPSPRPGSGTEDSPAFKRGHNTSRAASEDHIVVQDSKAWGWQGSASARAPETRLSHRSRLNLRKATTNQGPRNFTQSFDTNELQRLRESAGGRPKYQWI